MSQWNGAVQKGTLSPNLLVENSYVMLFIKLSRVVSSLVPKTKHRKDGFLEVLISENGD